MPDGAVAAATQNGATIGWVVPEEGAVMWVDVPEELDASGIVTVADPGLLMKHRGQRMVLLPFIEVEAEDE